MDVEQPIRSREGRSRSPGPSRSSGFVGRKDELAELLDGLKEAGRGRGGLFLLAGEPGIGKSRLADELSNRARDGGLSVLWGRCWEAGGAPAYWPWMQSIRGALRRRDGAALLHPLGPRLSDLTLMLPEVHEIVPGIPETAAADPETMRFRLFDAVSAFLRNAAVASPIVIVLDDLHVADTPSLLLLRFLASQLHDSRLLLLGTYRDLDLEPGHPLSETVAELVREPATRQLRLRGLTEADTAQFIELTTGAAATRSVVRAVHRVTEGNPLFLGEVVRLLAAEGRLSDPAFAGAARTPIPEGVRETILRRLARLSPDCRHVLSVASVLGREFSLETLKRLSDAATSDLLGLLDEASSARVITDVPGSLGRLRFSHSLIRDTLYEEIPAPRRFDLHRRAGEVLERLHGADVRPHLTELAHHFVDAAPGGDGTKAIEYARRAAQSAVDRVAYEEAVRLYGLGIQVLELMPQQDPAARCDLMLGMGDAQTKAGDGPGAKQTFLEAAELARTHRMAERLASAALGYGGRFVWLRPGHDTRMIPLLEEALAAQGEGDSVLAVSLMARLAGAMRDQLDRGPRDTLSARALEMARRIGDPATLAYALVARFAANWGPENDEERLALATELVDVARAIGDLDRELEGHLLLVKVMMTTGDLTGVYRELDACERLAARQQQPSQQWYVEVDRAVLALFEGRFDHAEEVIRRVLRLGERAQGMDAQVAYRLQMFLLRKEQGRIEDMEETIRRSIAEFEWYPMFRCVLANLYAELEREAEARRLLDELAEQRYEALPLDNEWLFAMCFLPEVASFLGDREAAATLYDLLLPYADRNAFSPPELCIGPVSRYLGVLAATMGRWDEADRHFLGAVEMGDRMGARPWSARARLDHARMLLRRDDPGDRVRARELLVAALADGREMGMVALESRAEELLRGAGEEAEQPAGEPLPHQPAVFRLEGDYWTVAYGGRAIRLRDTKGLRYIQRLVSEPGRELHVFALASEGAAPTPARSEPGLAPDSGHAGEALDTQATAAYRRRVDELQEEMEEAERWADPERAARARQELEFIEEELASAYGLGRRPRRAADTTERMRKAVTNRIRDSLARIRRDHPELGRHLANAISTGTFCSYAPDRNVSWDL